MRLLCVAEDLLAMKRDTFVVHAYFVEGRFFGVIIRVRQICDDAQIIIDSIAI